MIYMWIFTNMPDVFAKYVYNMQKTCFVLTISVVHYNITLNKNMYCMLQWIPIFLLFHANTNYY